MTEEQLCPLCGDLAVINESSKLTIEALLAERDMYRELVNNTSIHLSELKAEVERLKGELQQERADRERAWIANWRFTISVESSEPERPGPYNRVTATIADIGHADRGVILDPEVPLVPASDVVSLKAEVKRLKSANAAARELMATLWNSADDWHGPKASSHYRSELIEKMAMLIDRGDSWPTEGKS